MGNILNINSSTQYQSLDMQRFICESKAYFSLSRKEVIKLPAAKGRVTSQFVAHLTFSEPPVQVN